MKPTSDPDEREAQEAAAQTGRSGQVPRGIEDHKYVVAHRGQPRPSSDNPITRCRAMNPIAMQGQRRTSTDQEPLTQTAFR